MENFEEKNDLQPYMDFDLIPQNVNFDFNNRKTTKIPFDEILNAGNIASASTSLFLSFQSLTSEFPLYKAIDSTGNPITLPFLCKKGAYGFAPGFNTDSCLNCARFVPTDNVADMATVATSTTMLTVSLVLSQVLKKLDDIQDTGQKILDFLNSDKKAKQRGDLLYLSELFDQYKRNMTDEAFRRTALNKIEDIKHESLQNIIFYKNQANSLLSNNRKLKNSDQKLTDMCDTFEEYRIALYLYTLSTFLSILVIGNFESDYLKQTEEKIFRFSNEYRSLYTDAYNTLKHTLDFSMQNNVLGGLSGITKGVSNIFTKIKLEV